MIIQFTNVETRKFPVRKEISSMDMRISVLGNDNQEEKYTARKKRSNMGRIFLNKRMWI
jgi:hypothetical protein